MNERSQLQQASECVGVSWPRFLWVACRYQRLGADVESVHGHTRSLDAAIEQLRPLMRWARRGLGRYGLAAGSIWIADSPFIVQMDETGAWWLELDPTFPEHPQTDRAALVHSSAEVA